MEFKVVLGVIPGYGHENKDLTASNAHQVGMEEWEKASMEVSDMPIDPENPKSDKLYCIHGKVIPAFAVYSANFGCPAGGEVGVQIEAEMEDGQTEEVFRKSVIETIKVAMANLSQSTTTIEWSNDGMNIGTTYIVDGGKTIHENDALSGIEHFSVVLGEKSSDEEYVRTGSAIQKAMDVVSNTSVGGNDGKYYMISGIMTQTENGEIQFGASQNPMYGQTDNALYRKSVEKTIMMVMKELGQQKAEIDFGSDTLSLDLDELAKNKDGVDRIGE